MPNARQGLRIARARTCLAALFMLPVLAQAGIVREAILNTESSSFDPSFGDSSAVVRAAVTPALDTDFGSIGETELVAMVKAPVGMRFRVSFPTAGGLQVFYEGGSTGGGGSTGLVATIAFGGFGGDAIGTPFQRSWLLPAPGKELYQAVAGWNLAAGTDFWFESLSITSLVPAGYDVDVTTSPGARAHLLGYISSGDPGYGQFVRLEAIPSTSGAVPLPAGWLLFGLGGLLLAGHRRRAG